MTRQRMRVSSVVCLAMAVAPAMVSMPSLASAQAGRTWVSGVGDDVNPCSRTAPCKTFAGAILKTAPGGEISCLDSGGYAPVIITRSITIDCGDALGSIFAAPGAPAVTVNGAGIIVTLRGLSINGAGSGNVGIRVMNAATLNLANTRVFGFGAANEVGAGIQIDGGGVRVFIAGATISGNGDGIRVRPTGAATVMLVDSEVTGNAGAGIAVGGSGAQMRVGRSVVTGNAVGVQASAGASILSYGDNRLDGNSSDGAFTGTVAPRR